MKRMIRILMLAVTLVAGLTTASAQTVQVTMLQRIPALPSTVTSYMDDPLRYFNVQFFVTGAGSEGLDIFFDMNFTVDTDPNLYVRTIPGTMPFQPIHLFEGNNILKSDVLNTQVLSRVETKVDYSNPMSVQQLPEGTYQVCLDIYRWTDVDRVNNLTIGPCPTFEICYSGSAPELVSPMAGTQMALNGAMVVAPNRRIDFFWTPVISNCIGRSTRFKYKLKVVKVINGQNYQDAIKVNPTVFSAEVPNITYAVFDTLRDIKVQMEPGALYVAQVQAERIQPSRGSDDPFIIANDGNSQPMPFYWGGTGNQSGTLSDIENTTYYPNEVVPSPTGVSSRKYGYTVDDESKEGEESEGVEGITLWTGGVTETSDLETIAAEMKEQYLAGFIRDAAAVARLTETHPEEWKFLPTPKRRYVESDGYYTVPMSDDLEVSFMPSRHPALKNVAYAIELYDFVDGGLDSILTKEPLHREVIEELPESYNKMDSHQLVNRTLTGWGSKLKQGNLYYLQLVSYPTIGYWNYSIADTCFFVNKKLAEHVIDTISREFVEGDMEYGNGVFFQWGDDPEVPGLRTPQWVAPVDRTDADIYDPANVAVPAVVPEVKKAKSFPVSWTPYNDVAEGDQSAYEVNVYELKDGQSPEEAVATNKLLASRTVTEAKIAEDDTAFFKVFSAGKTYVMTLTTGVFGESEYTYHFENGSTALPIVFKIVK